MVEKANPNYKEISLLHNVNHIEMWIKHGVLKCRILKSIQMINKLRQINVFLSVVLMMNFNRGHKNLVKEKEMIKKIKVN